ncbi:MAG: hypothetical protein GY805_30010 [Chloroflexi bacterium]|nr:hypothetical protein [Chloroflexota bacterium]
MEPITHIWLTRQLIGKERKLILSGILPDAPFYTTYPAWVIKNGMLRHAIESNEWPEPPVWMEMCHHAFHSLPLLMAGGVAARLILGRWPGKLMAAWGLHILVDIPTHSRRQWGPRFLWPFSNFAVDGISWAEWMIGWYKKS